MTSHRALTYLLLVAVCTLTTATASNGQRQQWCTEAGVQRESQQQYEAAVQAYQECSRNTTSSGPVAAWSMYRAFNVLFNQLKDNQRALAACTAGWDAHNAPELAWCAGFVSVYLQQHSEAKEWAERAIGLGCFNGSCQPLEAVVPAHSGMPVQSCSWEGPWDVLVWANKGLGDTAGAEEASRLHTQAQQARLGHTPASNSLECPVDEFVEAKGEVVMAHRVSWWVEFLGPHWTVPCTWQGQPLSCQYLSTSHADGNCTAQTALKWAQAFVTEGCWAPADVPAQYQDKLQVMFSLESDTSMHQCFDKQVADVEMTYRSQSQVWTPYWAFFGPPLGHNLVYNMETLRSAPVPAPQKLNAIAYINSNCAAHNDRHTIMRELQALLKQSGSSLEVHSYGKCDSNMDAATLADFRAPSDMIERAKKKLEVFSKYKFCVAMENSVNKDYVSEKLYDGLVAGCVPIYLGAPNIADFVPEESAIIDYAQLGSPQALQAELERLAGDEQAYAAKLEWKTKDTKRWNAGFQQLLAYSETHPMCQLCRFVADARQTGQPKGHTLCSANTSWQGVETV